ncbi:hypothetical protein BDW22DRAFT_1485199 [Trametopsis cervina]|nr:hypothetical protein BDW22DRAFT_1485199 [Trametopsis cervina]
MALFRPTRSSPPLRIGIKNPTVVAAEEILSNSRSSATSATELAALSPEEIDFIDTVIAKAGTAATTFLTIFKAYNDTLQERGIDPQHEVVYYGKLLKLGTLKGKNWADKWEAVKEQQNGGVTTKSKDQTPRPPLPNNRAKILTRLTGALKTIEKDDDAFTLHSHQEDTESEAQEASETEADATPIPLHRIRSTSRSTQGRVSPAMTSTVNSFTSKAGPSVIQPRASTSANKIRRPFSRTAIAWDAESSDGTVETAHASSSVPPSYNAATRELDNVRKSSYTPLRALARAHVSSSASQASTSHVAPPAARAIVTQAREHRGTVINEDDAWNKIRMARDEKEADRCREERLQERCWEVWKQGFQWIVTTNEQIAQARDNLIIRLALHNWRAKTAKRRELYHRVAKMSDGRRLKTAMQLWRTKLKERKQAQWRNDMRMRMKTVRDNRDLKLKKDAWAKWRQSYRSHISEQHYSEKLVLRFYDMWRRRLAQLSRLEVAAIQLSKTKEKSQRERCWDLWRRAMDMRKAERTMKERVGLRILSNVIDVWKKRMLTNQIADDFHDRLVLKHTIRRWQSAQGRTNALEHRAEKYQARQNDVLVRAIWRVWKAHERGKLLERVKGARLLAQTWSVWTQRLHQQRQREEMAVHFSLRSSSTLASSTLQRWQAVYISHQNAQAFAVHYHSIQLRFKMVLVWRLQLRAKLKLVKQAKAIEKYFVMRNAWRIWQEKQAGKRREQKLKVFDARIMRVFMHQWQERMQSQRQLKLSEEVISQRVDLRIMTTVLTQWTNRVADLKFRELEVSSRYQNAVVATAFKKWKNICIRHVEELSLMESYQDVKREENMRRMFNRWLTATRKSRHRRLLLQEKEDELKLAIVAGAWDRWREQYLDTRLRPMADTFLLQSQKNLVFRTFGIWHSRTNSLPAVRFHASHLKARFWATWRDAMPRALQAREAREVERRSVLTKALERWTRAYKTKIELKAVARARYLRLPTAAPRQNSSSPRSLVGGKPSAPDPSYVRAPARPVSPLVSAEGPSATRPVASAGLYKGRLGIAKLLSERSKSPERPSRPKLSTTSPTRRKVSTRASTARDPSPARTVSSHGYAKRQKEPFLRAATTAPPSAAGETDDVGRGKLWQELRGLQLRSRAPTDTVSLVSHEPP